jgi:broad specificity phosphatase PhoE
VIAFVRHGQTALNREGRLQGRLDAPLSEAGMEQARAVAARLASDPIARVISSPLQRAQQTAQAIAVVQGVAVEIDERLIELDYGEWDGVPLNVVPVDAWATWRSDPTYSPPGGESLVDVTARISEFLADVGSNDELVIAVSHVSPIKAAVCLALGADERASWRMQLGIAAVSRIGRRADGSPYLLSFNEPG